MAALAVAGPALGSRVYEMGLDAGVAGAVGIGRAKNHVDGIDTDAGCTSSRCGQM